MAPPTASSGSATREPHTPAAPGCAVSFVLAHPNVAEPLQLDEVFDPARPLEIDIGCGKGRFLLARAAATPETQYLGVDRLLERVRKTDGKLCRAGLRNVRLLRLEAGYTVAFLLPPHRVRTFYVYFPDPWPKRRHHKRRLMSPEFREAVWSRLVPGGRIEFATDHLDYLAEIQRLFRGDPRFREVPPLPRSEAERTDFEIIFRSQGLPIGECAFQTGHG
jgi:tRNA (guanine-N7-)-methyltransferase